MEGYKIIKSRRGIRYTKDSKLVKKADVPQEVLTRLHSDHLVEQTPDKVCVVCGAYGKMTRFINGQSVYLCDEDFYDKTVGQIVQAIREKSTDKETSNAPV